MGWKGGGFGYIAVAWFQGWSQGMCNRHAKNGNGGEILLRNEVAVVRCVWKGDSEYGERERCVISL